MHLDCIGGGTDATAAADGSFSTGIFPSALKTPCVITATSTVNGQQVMLHSIASNSGTFNVTPLTDLLVTTLTQQAGQGSVDQLAQQLGTNSSIQQLLSDTAAITKVEQAVTSLVSTNANALPNSTNFLTTPFTAGNHTGPDADLDNLAATGIVNPTTGVPTSNIQAAAAAVGAQLAINSNAPVISTTSIGGNPAPASPNPYLSRNYVSVVNSLNRENIPAWTAQADLQKNMVDASAVTGNSTGNMLNMSFTLPGGVSGRGYDAIQWQIDFLRFEPSAPVPETRYVAVQGTVRDGNGGAHTFYFGINMPNYNQNYTGQARISLFGTGGVPNASTCDPGADGGAGFSCSVPYVFTQGHTYQLLASVQHVSGMPGGNALTGTVRDETTGVLTDLGSFGLQNGVASLDVPVMWAEGTDNAPCSQISNFAVRVWPLAMYANSVRTDLMPHINSVNCSKTLYKTLADGSTLIAYGPWVTPVQ